MVEALSLIKLQNRVRERYDYDEQRVVGIILARYDIRITKEIVDQCYQYWNLRRTSSRSFRNRCASSWLQT